MVYHPSLLTASGWTYINCTAPKSYHLTYTNNHLFLRKVCEDSLKLPSALVAFSL